MNDFKSKPFVKVIYLANSGVAGNSGENYSSPKPFADGDLCSIPAGTVITRCWYVIDTAITGTTALTVGDDDDADGFIADIAANLATPGCYNTPGAYVDGAKEQKGYHVAGKEVKLDNTTTNTAGKMRIFIEGYSYPIVS